MTKNFWLKALSLAVALVFSYYVRSESNSTIVSFLAPVELQNVPPTKIIVGPEARQAQVTLRGPAFLVSKVASSAPIFRVKLPSQFSDRLEVTLSPGLISVPPSVEVLSIEPSFLTLEFDNIASKEVKVRIPTIGSVNSGRRFQGLRVTPSTVTLRGPEALLHTVTSVDSSPIDLSIAERTTTQEVPLRAPDGQLRVEPDYVTVEVQIVEELVERTFGQLKVQVRSEGNTPIHAVPGEVAIELSGAKNTLDRLRAEDLVPFVELSGAPEKARQYDVQLLLPEGVSVVVMKPSAVQLALAQKKGK